MALQHTETAGEFHADIEPISGDDLGVYILCIIPAIVMSFVMGAHFIRWSQPGLAVISLLSPLLLVSRQRWIVSVYRTLLFAGTLQWIHIILQLISRRLASGQQMTRAAIIMCFIALATFTSALLLGTRSFRKRHNLNSTTARASLAAFIAVVLIASFPHVKMKYPVPLIAERILPGSGWIEIILLGIYAGWLSGRLITGFSTSRIRGKVWTLFSLVFTIQLIMGISGFTPFLMTGHLHLPIPAMILAGPVYRGSVQLFMPVLLLSTVIISGPAWCSWFCYFGCWDFLASGKKSAGKLNTGRSVAIRLFILLLLTVSAMIFRRVGMPVFIAASAGLVFGLLGIGVILIKSRKTGLMFHCTHFCPISLITTLIGKINPFRIRIAGGCNGCHSCLTSCRYGALSAEQIRRRKPGITCTLCGDCVSACPSRQIEYRFPALGAQEARILFTIIIVVIHTLFLGFGRI